MIDWPPRLPVIRLTVEPKNAEPLDFFPAPGSFGVADDFTFELTAAADDVTIGATATTLGAKWVLKAVRHRSTDVTDAGIELASARNIDGVEVVMTTRVQEVSGVVTNDKGEIVTGCTVFVFAQDRERWGAGTRYLAMGRPDQEGRYTLTTLPPGEYFAVAAEYIDENRRSGDSNYLEALSFKATKFSVREGEPKRLDLKLEMVP